MNTALWICQTLVAALFLFSGVTKGTWSREKLLANGQTGVAVVPMWLLRPVAFLEVLGAFGVLLPVLTGIAEWLTPVAALGLATIMVGAAGIHFSLKEPKTALLNLTFLAVCVFIAVGRA